MAKTAAWIEKSPVFLTENDAHFILGTSKILADEMKLFKLTPFKINVFVTLSMTHGLRSEVTFLFKK